MLKIYAGARASRAWHWLGDVSRVAPPDVAMLI
jgi:hypothetical protein